MESHTRRFGKQTLCIACFNAEENRSKITRKENSMKRYVLLAISTLFLITVNFAQAADLEETVSAAMSTLNKQHGDRTLLLLTDAPYVKIDGSSALPFLSTIQNITGCTVGNGNLLFYQRPQQHVLRFMLMSKTNGKTVIVSKNNNTWLSETIQLDRSTIATQEFWQESKSFIAAEDIFSLAGIGGAWAMDAPYDYLKVAELHNHLCPGVTSGYLLANYIKNHFALMKGDSYTIIASPVWCKEDALQVILDRTAGKRGIVVKPLAKEIVEQISYANPAGMVLIWNAKEEVGKGYALTFDYDILKKYAPADSPKIAVLLAGLEHFENPDQYVTTAASFDLDKNTYDKITQAGSNPYQVVGLMK